MDTATGDDQGLLRRGEDGDRLFDVAGLRNGATDRPIPLAEQADGEVVGVGLDVLGRDSTTAPVSAGLASTRKALGSAVISCSGRVIRSKNAETGRNESLTVRFGS